MSRRTLTTVPPIVTLLVIAALSPTPDGVHRAAAAREDDGNPGGGNPGGGDPVGLSLFFQNGLMKPITLIGDNPRFFQEIDIVATTNPTHTDQGIAPLLQHSEFASLDWRGIHMVDVDWRKNTDGTYQREQFFRGAAWMKQASRFQIVPTDDLGRGIGPALSVNAGTDEQFNDNDDGFVRRFVVRQVASGCRGMNDTTGATFTVQGLVQVRDALHPENTVAIPADATQLRLEWDRQPQAHRVVAISHQDPGNFPYGYGFQIDLAPSPPRAGKFYRRGEQFRVQITFRDGQGNRLHPPGSLPSYGEFIANGATSSGIRYINFGFNTTLFYALKHRESTMLLAFDGPTSGLKQSSQAIDLGSLFSGQGVGARARVDGYSAGFVIVPPITTLVNPALWNDPVPDTYSLTVPPDALPGTYVVVLKARREFGGEALNRAKSIDIQVGTSRLTGFANRAGRCNDCHEERSGFANLLHGLEDFRACYACHASLTTEPDNALDIRVHTVHDRSERFRSLEGGIKNCTLCHVTTPRGPARGILNPPRNSPGHPGSDR